MLTLPQPSKQFLIKPLRNSDEHLFTTLYSDAETMQNIAPTATMAEIAMMFQRCLRADRQVNSPRRFYTLVSRCDSHPLGIISRVPTGIAEAPAELGIMLLKKARGTGCADEALASLCLYCFEHLQMPAVMVRCHPLNKGACQLNLRLGFTAAPMKQQDQAGLLCWWLQNTPQQQQLLTAICAGKAT